MTINNVEVMLATSSRERIFDTAQRVLDKMQCKAKVKAMHEDGEKAQWTSAMIGDLFIVEMSKNE
jgi:hypothetical protein